MMRSLIAAAAILASAPAGAQAPTTGPAPATGAALASASQAPTVASASPAPTDSSAEVAALVTKVQSFYEASQGFDTRFEQRFAQAGVPSRFAGAAATGRMRFRKPTGGSGPLMRWDYADGRILLLVKDRSWTYDPDTKQATEYRVDPAQLSAAVTFMWGTGKLEDEFNISLSSRKLGEGKVLELTPKKPGSFSKVFLLVAPSTGMVERSVVVQANGSENDISFKNATVNAKLTMSDFDPDAAFPKGTARTKAAIPGQ